MESNVLAIALLLIAIVLFFEFSNGFNDCANMVVTPVITGAMEPRRALLLIAVFEFVGAWFLGTAVAQTLGKGIVNPKNITVVSHLCCRRGGYYLEPGGMVFRHALQLFPCPDRWPPGGCSHRFGTQMDSLGQGGAGIGHPHSYPDCGLGRWPLCYPKGFLSFSAILNPAGPTACSRDYRFSPRFPWP